MYYTYSYTNIGKKRLNNEDRVLINGKILQEDEHYIESFPAKDLSHFIVADGMGGHAAGEIASEIIVNYFKSEEVLFDEFALNKTLRIINEQVIEYSNNNLDGESIGATVAGVFTLGNEALVFNAGDSLIYSFEKGSYTELSISHNTYTYEAKTKRFGGFSRPGGLLEFIGNRRPNLYFPYNIFKRRIKKGEILFIATDGVTNYYPDPLSLARLFSEERDITVCAQKIIDHVLSSGAHDNFSFSIIIKKSESK